MATPIPTNTARFTATAIAGATGGAIVRRGSAETVGIATDSRAVVPGSAFVALRGENSDGHSFVDLAVQRGARIVVVERGRGAAVEGADVVEVDDTLRAWGDLARAHLRRWRDERRASGGARVVAITGSAGKTTTKELCASILAAVGTCLATTGNLNNRIGLPATAFCVDTAHRFVILEAGMSVRGEIAELARIAEPDVAVVTNIGVAHAGGVGGALTDVAREKGALYAGLAADGVAIVNVDDPAAVERAERSGARTIVGFGRGAAARYRIEACASRGGGGAHVVVVRDGGRVEVDLPILGEAAGIDFAAALAAADVAAGKHISAELFSSIAFHAVAGRGAVRRLGRDVLLVDDTYNANPASVRNALAGLAEIGRVESRRTVAILGEMRELGTVAEAEHTAIGDALVSAGVSLVIGSGGLVDLALARAASGGVATIRGTSSADAAQHAVAAIRPRDVVLVKGSRGVALERVVEEIVRAVGVAGEPH
jgi:UDP-N-acetylmuramoyl-tripeptide--D-alanyl-D-alanine ligase